MKSVVALLVLCLCAVAYAQEENVVTLTDEKFDETINNYEFALVEFYAPWCGHCKHLAPEYEKAATTLKESELASKVLIAKVDATVEKEKPSVYGVRGYPTLKFFIGGVSGTVTDYNGPRTADGIVAWLKKKTGPATVSLATQSDIDNFVNSNALAVVGYVETSELDKFKSVAQKVEAASFGVVTDPALIAETGSNTIKFHRNFDKSGPVTISDISQTTADQLQQQIGLDSFPAVNDIFGPEVFPKLAQHEKPIVVAVESLSAASLSDEYKAKLESLAAQWKGKLFVTYTTGQRVPGLLDQAGSSKSTFPTYIAVIPAKGGKQTQPTLVPIDDETAVTDEQLSKWLESLVAGTYEIKKKSQPAPADNTGNVFVLVYSNFEENVLKSDKIVLVEFYAPWCGHCKKLEPIYEKLGEEFKSDSRVLVAKLDATANYVDPDLGVTGFPTIILFNNGKTTTYKGERTQVALSKFIRDNLPKVDHDEL